MVPKHLEPRGRALGPASRGSRARLRLLSFASALALAATANACSKSADRPPTPAVEDAGLPKPTPTPCSSPDTGCPCETSGESVSCGEIIFKSDAYITCSIGTRTCGEDEKWGICAGQQIVTLNAWQKNGLRPQAQPGGVGAANTCDPFLFNINTDLTNGDAGLVGTGVQIGDSGAVELTQVTGLAGGCVGAQTITISPNASPGTDLVLTSVTIPPTPNSIRFSATLPACAGVGTAPVWTMDQPSYATISTSGVLSLQYPYVGPIHVTAYAGGLSATVTVNVSVSVVDHSKVTNGGPIATSFLSTCGVP